MLFDPVPRTSFSASGNYVRTAAVAIGDVAARTIQAIGRLCHAFAVNLLRRYVRQALHSVSDRRPLGPASRAVRSTPA